MSTNNPRSLTNHRSFWRVTDDELMEGYRRVVAELADMSRYPLPEPYDYSLEALERRYIKHVLDATETLNEAAIILGISKRALWTKRKKYGFD